MTYRTIQGRDVFHPYEAVTKICGNMSRSMGDDTKAWMTQYQRLFDEMVNLDRECTTLRDAKRRLEHENEFMLRLVNDRDAWSSSQTAP